MAYAMGGMDYGKGGALSGNLTQFVHDPNALAYYGSTPDGLGSAGAPGSGLMAGVNAGARSASGQGSGVAPSSGGSLGVGADPTGGAWGSGSIGPGGSSGGGPAGTGTPSTAKTSTPLAGLQNAMSAQSTNPSVSFIPALQGLRSGLAVRNPPQSLARLQVRTY